MLEILPPLVLGAVISWVIAWYYFRKQNKEKPAWFTAKTIKKILHQRPEDIEWTTDQILKLYKNKIHNIDESESVPYGVCPECGSSAIRHSSSVDEVHEDVYESHECRKCGWVSGGEV